VPANLQHRSLLHAAATSLILLWNLSLSGCVSATNSPEIRDREAALIPGDLYEIAPNVALSISLLRTRYKDEELSLSIDSGATGTLLPNGEMLTAAHAFETGIHLSRESEVGVVYPFLVGKNLQFASVLAYEPVDSSNGDWALLFFGASETRVLPPDPQFVQSIRFDGNATIHKGTPLYCLGYPRTPGEYSGTAGFPRELTIVQGRATRDFGPEEEIVAFSDTELDMRGMSGGPVGTFDFWKREFTVVGTAARGSNGARFFGLRWPYFYASRIAPVVMQRLDQPAQPDATAAPN